METIPAKVIASSKVEKIHDVHLTGGVRASLTDDGWSLHPVRDGNTLGCLLPMQLGQLNQFVQKFGLRTFGGDAITNPRCLIPVRVWTTLPELSKGRLQPADEWSSIACNAHLKGHKRASQLATHISFSLRAAGIRLRDASDHYNKQLMKALEDGRVIGELFSNPAIYDLYLAFHSLLSEMGSARDYLAAEMARRVNAPEKVDSLARFVDWISAPSHASLAAEPIIAEMLEAYRIGGEDPWLYNLTKYRNLFLHKEPIGANKNAKFLRLGEREDDGLRIPVIELTIHAASESDNRCDALERFVDLHQRLLTLAAKMADESSYEVTPPRIGISGFR